MRGFVHPDFEPVRDALALCVPSGRAGGAAVAVYHRGVKVVDLAAGTRDEAGRPFDVDSLAVSMSTTKGVTASALHVLIGRGEVELDAPVCSYWPEFAQNGKSRISVRQALAHQAGLHEVAPLVTRFDQLYDWAFMVRAIERARPVHEPGADFGYHAFTYGWLIGEIVRRVTGAATFSEALDAVLARPLGVDGLFVGVPEGAMTRVADVVGLRALPPIPRGLGKVVAKVLGVGTDLVGANVEPDEAARALFPPGISELDLNDPAFRRASLPAVNGHFDARSLARLYAALLGAESFEGPTLVPPHALDVARDDHNGFFAACRVIPFPLRIGLGYHRIISLGLRLPLPGRSVDLGIASPSAFGHFGIGGSGAWADPERDLAVGLVTNTFFGKLPMDLRTVAIATAAAYCADRR